MADTQLITITSTMSWHVGDEHVKCYGVYKFCTTVSTCIKQMLEDCASLKLRVIQAEKDQKAMDWLCWGRLLGEFSVYLEAQTATRIGRRS